MMIMFMLMKFMLPMMMICFDKYLRVFQIFYDCFTTVRVAPTKWGLELQNIGFCDDDNDHDNEGAIDDDDESENIMIMRVRVMRLMMMTQLYSMG